ncbi:cuticle protein 14-like [Centruroides sculpturatus]|uniref:cuticle protein 14-like n=1 Tax=Centruroides sculpturatus TaxID=218467 RepID=UPI000C6E88BA|nr:cuticle protein 14-like [Centruroides sculpturatus]XP_023211313.1 cuticle protein 14-like [Centruroides sculpturatus]
MKLLILCAVLAAAQAVPILHHLGTGVSSQVRTQDVLGNYHFGYNEGHGTGATFRRESGDLAGNKVGAYGLSVADGRHRVVNYVADAAGFRADIQTNEPGVDSSKDPASVSVNKIIPAVVPAVHAYLPFAPLGYHYVY